MGEKKHKSMKSMKSMKVKNHMKKKRLSKTQKYGQGWRDEEDEIFRKGSAAKNKASVDESKGARKAFGKTRPWSLRDKKSKTSMKAMKRMKKK